MKEEKIRSQKYLKFVRKYPCLVCSKEGVHAHHLRHAQRRGWGMKNGDQWVVPLCAEHHMDCHRTGRESMWWALNGIDSLSWAEKSYKKWSSNEKVV